METRAEWDRIAPGYDRTNTPSQMWLGAKGLEHAGIRPGMRFLDVAAGSGALSIPAARLGALVTAVDQSEVMLELLAARAHKEGLKIATQVMDGQALRFDDDTFDAAGSQFGVMLFPDMPRGIREMARVVKPAGRVLVSAYGDPHRIDFLGFFVQRSANRASEFHRTTIRSPAAAIPVAGPTTTACRARGGGTPRCSGRDDRGVDELPQRPGAVGMDRVEQSDRRVDPRRTATSRPGPCAGQGCNQSATARTRGWRGRRGAHQPSQHRGWDGIK